MFFMYSCIFRIYFILKEIYIDFILTTTKKCRFMCSKVTNINISVFFFNSDYQIIFDNYWYTDYFAFTCVTSMIVRLHTYISHNYKHVICLHTSYEKCTYLHTYLNKTTFKACNRDKKTFFNKKNAVLNIRHSS